MFVVVVFYCTGFAFCSIHPCNIQFYFLIQRPRLKDGSELCHLMMDGVPSSGILNRLPSNNNMRKYFSSVCAAMLDRPGRQYYGNLGKDINPLSIIFWQQRSNMDFSTVIIYCVMSWNMKLLIINNADALVCSNNANYMHILQSFNYPIKITVRKRAAENTLNHLSILL